MGVDDPHAAEQRYIDGLYTRLDELRSVTAARLADVRLQRTRHRQALFERDVEAIHLEGALARYDIGNAVLCFGRLNLDDGSQHYIGRLGISNAAQDPLLVDWRAPAAEPFYRATARAPEGVALRRHLLCEGRRLVAIDDEVFDEKLFETPEGVSLRGDAALMAALRRRRTGRMADIVATIQAEQDAIIRARLEGALLVQGGPGTGKTAVALHRAAYLLYTHRARLAAQGVLIVGPSSVFLRYIDQVLPSLGETGVVLARVGDLFPGVKPRLNDTPAAAQVKGRAEMVRMLQQAIAIRQRVLRESVTIGYGAVQLKVTPHDSHVARRRARGRRRRHNEARPSFEAAVLDGLVEQAVEKERVLGRGDGDGRRPEIRSTIRRSRDFRALMTRLWPVLTANELLADLYSSRPLIRAAGRGLLNDHEVALVHRPTARDVEEWSAADVPLLDEAAELLGSPPPRKRRRRGARPGDGPDLFDAAGVGEPGGPTLEEAARADRTWSYGHVIVDEAQEVSPMAWRAIARRCPQLSMTIVGDWAQRGTDWGYKGWGDALGPVARRLRVTELTVNYRTPREVMDVAAAVLRSTQPDVMPPSAVRDSGVAPWSLETDDAGLAEVTAGVAAAELRIVGDGRIAVIVPTELRQAVAEALRRALAERVATEESEALDRAVSVMEVGAAKGLEFDSVVIVEPGSIMARMPRGANDLYVALTRTTGRLGLIHTTPLPAELAGTRTITHIESEDTTAWPR